MHTLEQREEAGKMSRRRHHQATDPSGSNSRPVKSIFGATRLTERVDKAELGKSTSSSHITSAKPLSASKKSRGSVMNQHEILAAPLINRYSLQEMMNGVCTGKMVPTSNSTPLNRPLYESAFQQNQIGAVGAANITNISRGSEAYELDSDVSSEKASFMCKHPTASRLPAQQTSAAHRPNTADAEVGVRRSGDINSSSKDKAAYVHALHRLQKDNVQLRQELRSVRDKKETDKDTAEDLQVVADDYRRQLMMRDQDIAELRAHTELLAAQLRTANRENAGLNARLTSLSEEREQLMTRMDSSAQPIVQQMDKVMTKLREDFNVKVDEVLRLRDECMVLQVELRQKDEKLAYKESEIEVLNKQVASLRDYVVTSGQTLSLQPTARPASKRA